MKMNLFRISPIPSPQFMVVAETAQEAGSIFATYGAAIGVFRAGKLKIDLCDPAEEDERRPGVEMILDQNCPGIAEYTTCGWVLKPLG